MKTLVYGLSPLVLLLASAATPAMTTDPEQAFAPVLSVAGSGDAPESGTEEAPGADVGC